MAELVFFSGTMDCGKSTLALQTDHNHAARGRAGIVFSRLDRAGEDTLSSRLGLKVPAVEVSAETDFWQHVTDVLAGGGRVDYLICDEAQFYERERPSIRLMTHTCATTITRVLKKNTMPIALIGRPASVVMNTGIPTSIDP